MPRVDFSPFVIVGGVLTQRLDEAICLPRLLSCPPARRRASAPPVPSKLPDGIAFYAFSPLAGGMLTGKYQRDTTVREPGSRYDPQ